MKILKRIAVALMILIAIPLTIALFVKKDYQVQRSILIEKPNPEVFGYIKLLRNHNNFNKWSLTDPNIKNEYRGTDGTIGFVSAWSSDVSGVGSGEQEIRSIVEDRRIDYEIRFFEPFASKAPVFITTRQIAEDQTEVNWGFEGRMPYPLNVVRLVVDVEKLIGQDLDQSLRNMKSILEQTPSLANGTTHIQ